jgi:HB1, ASXL, restriction endonuclease HTH domain
MSEKLNKAELKLALARAEKELQETVEHAQSLREWIIATKKLCGRKLPTANSAVLSLIPRRRTKTAILATQVAAVLEEAGGPLHVKEIVGELIKRGQPVVAQNPIASVGVALSRRADQFVKVAGNTFDLRGREVKAG